MAESEARDTENVEEKVSLKELADQRNHEHTIYQRVHAVMMELGPIERTHTHEIWKDGKKKGEFPYISHDDVTAHVRRAMIRHGIMVVPTVTKRENNGNRTEIDVSVTFVNVDKPEDKIEILVPGYGVDFADKGPGKAFSYAVKYAYLKLFMLNSSDDIEEHDMPHEREGDTGEVERFKLEAKESIEAAASNYKAALENCQTLEDFEKLKKANKGLLRDAPDVTKQFFVDLERNIANKLS